MNDACKGRVESTDRQEIKDTVWKLLSLANISLPCPSIPLRNFLSHGCLIGQIDFAKQIQNAPETLDLRDHRRLDGMDLSENDERTIILNRQVERNGAFVEAPAALSRSVICLGIPELGACGEERESLIDCLGSLDVVFLPCSGVFLMEGLVGHGVAVGREAEFAFRFSIEHTEVIAPAGAGNYVVSLETVA